jgi:hypothetical protein
MGPKQIRSAVLTLGENAVIVAFRPAGPVSSTNLATAPMLPERQQMDVLYLYLATTSAAGAVAGLATELLLLTFDVCEIGERRPPLLKGRAAGW